MRIVCLGDSITEGICDEEAKGGWAGRLACKIVSGVSPADMTLHNLGIAGHTSLQVEGRFFSEALPRNAQITFIAAGANDVARRLWPHDTGPKISLNFAKEIWTNITAEAAKNKDCHYIFISPLPVDEEKLPIIYMPVDEKDKGNDLKNADIKAYIQMQQQVVEGAGLSYFNLYEQIENEDALYRQYLENLPDGLHPNAKGYDILCDLIYDKLMALPHIKASFQSV